MSKIDYVNSINEIVEHALNSLTPKEFDDFLEDIQEIIDDCK